MIWLEWWNFMFLLPLVSGLVIAVLLVAMGLGGLGELDTGDAEMQADATKLELTDLSGDASELGGFSLGQILSFFGLAQGIPLSLMLPLLLVTGGLSGLLLNAALSRFINLPWLFAALSLVLSFAVSAFVGQGLAKLLRRFFKAGSTAIRKRDLLGLSGKAVYAISDTSGVAHVKDPSGNIHRIVCRTKDAQNSIAAGESLLLLAYDPKTKAYLVEPKGS